MTRCLPRRLLQPFKDTFFIDSAPVIECKSGMVVEQKKICISKVLFRRQNGILVRHAVKSCMKTFADQVT